MNVIKDSIKNLRKEKDMTQDELAEKLNVTRQAVSNWEQGKTQPDIETLTRLAEIFDVSVEHIIYGSERKEKIIHINRDIQIGPKEGISMGACLAMIISYAKWQSIGWAILHGMFNWAYVIYYIIKY
ncbi:MAG: helix-turn-helix transcriptional regulator [Lachnospiraceae bacterium]|nr:helix-turn-helix transcriptional regulator [Lachnospiraceae bacterium]MBP3578833.1 helix-turn-helix transcriptional regulator [Lachnospiraceae bacterium]